MALVMMCGLVCLGCRKRPGAGKLPAAGGAPPAPTLFFGRVTDQDGVGLDAVEVVVRTAELTPNPIMPGGNVPSNGKTFSVYTNDRGSFLVMLPVCHNDLVIEDVRKAGYDWVRDWAWQLPERKGENTVAFQFAGRYVRCPVYVPDASNPAVLPLHRRGSERAVANPSRGGADVDCNGRRTVNGPVVPAIPSAGPGAPRTDEEIGAAIRGYGERARGR